jgi:hypothetical protein
LGLIPLLSPYIYGKKGWALYEDIKLLMPSLAKGRKAYQANGLGTAQSNITSGASGSAQGSVRDIEDPVMDKGLATENGELAEVLVIATGSSSTAGIVSNDVGESNNIDKPTSEVFPPTSPPLSPSIASKQRFLAVGNTSDSLTLQSQSQPSSSHLSSSHTSSTSSSAKRGWMTGAIALTSIGHGIADLNTSYQRGLELDEAWHLDR